MTVRVVVADDEPLVRQGLRLVLEHDAAAEVVGEAADGEAAMALTREHRPDVVLLDIRMPVLDGIEAARRIVADPGLAGVHVVMLTTFADDALVVAVVDSTGSPRDSVVPGSGRGLVGLRERLSAFGGSLDSSATADGWRLEARIPLPEGSR